MSNKAFVSTNGDTTFPYSHLAINKNRLKEFNAKNDWYSSSSDYYLSGDTEFQVEIFNPTNETLGAKISINGKYISSSRLVLYPGQRVWLERDFDSNKKFKFIIYEVEKDNPIVEQAIAENGKIKIEFYKEEKREVLDWTHGWNNITWTNYNSDPYSTYTAGDTFDLKSNVSSIAGDMLGVADTILYSSIDSAPTARAMKETGRVGRSENASNQEFNTVSVDFCSLPYRIEYLNMHPLSEKQLTAEDTKIRRYCSHCGKKLKPTFKFCPACGTKVE